MAKKKKFIRSLAAQLAGDGAFPAARLLSMCADELEDFLRTALTPNRRRRRSGDGDGDGDGGGDGDGDDARFKFLQRHLHRPDFISALQAAIRELCPDAAADAVADADALKGRLLRSLSSWLSSSKSPLGFAASSAKESREEEEEREERPQLLLCRLRLQPLPVHLIWSVAALELLAHPLEHRCSAAEAATLLLACLKPSIVGVHGPSTPLPSREIAILGLAPLVPVLMQPLQSCSATTITSDIAKLLLPVVKEVLAFISVVCRNANQERMDDASQKLSVADLCAGFSSILQVLRFQAVMEKFEAPSESGELKLMFPLISAQLAEEMEKLGNVELGVLSEAVKVQFILLKMILEVIGQRGRALSQEKSNKSANIRGLSNFMGVIAVNCVALVDKGKDVILDVLLSNLYVGDVLDSQEIDLIRFLLYKAMLISDKSGFIDEPMHQATDLKKFLKKIMIARKMACDERLKGGGSEHNVEELVRKIDVPCGFLEQLKIGQRNEKLSESILQSDQAVIGWLLHLGDTEFQGLLEGTSGYNSESTKCLRIKELETKNLEHPLDIGDTFREAESLFFMDTIGESGDNAVEGNRDPHLDITTSKRKLQRKRKERQIRFHRQGKLMNEEIKNDEDLCPESSSDEHISDAEGYELKRHKEDIELAC